MEYIIMYTGDILSLGYPTELLDAQFAIMELGDQDPNDLLQYPQITSFEPARQLIGLKAQGSRYMDYRSMEAACIPQVHRVYGLTGPDASGVSGAGQDQPDRSSLGYGCSGESAGGLSSRGVLCQGGNCGGAGSL